MIHKISPSIAAALEGTPDGATVLIGGFGTAGIPSELIDGLIAQGARDLTIVNNNAGNGEVGLAIAQCFPCAVEYFAAHAQTGRWRQCVEGFNQIKYGVGGNRFVYGNGEFGFPTGCYPLYSIGHGIELLEQ